MKGVLIWKLPETPILEDKKTGKKPATINQRNNICRDLLGMELIGINQVVILVDGAKYYVIKNKITGAIGDGSVEFLHKLIEELENAL